MSRTVALRLVGSLRGMREIAFDGGAGLCQGSKRRLVSNTCSQQPSHLTASTLDDGIDCAWTVDSLKWPVRVTRSRKMVGRCLLAIEMPVDPLTTS